MQNHTTIFSRPEFAESWCRSFDGCMPLAVEVHGSGPKRMMYMVKQFARYGTYRLSCGRSQDLWTSPGWTGELSRDTVQHILHQLIGARTRSLQWQVRFDHEPLAKILISSGLWHRLVPIRVVDTDREYERVFAQYSATTRNNVRKAIRRGAKVRDTSDVQDILAFHAIYTRHAQDRKWNFIFPAQLIMDLVKSPELASFKVVEHENVIIGGALFLRDGNSVYDLIGIGDSNHKELFPIYAVTDAGLQWACEIKAQFFNFGNWGDSKALGEFKSFWGTRIEANWVFGWEHPFWRRVNNLKSVVRALTPKWGTISTPQRISNSSNDGEKSTLPDYGLPWAQKATLGELRAVCDQNGTEAKNAVMHGAGLVGAKKALSLARERGIRRPVVLDFGCGTGRMIRFFSKHDCQVFGLDITYEMLRQAQRYGLPKGSWLSQFDGVSIPLVDRSVDIVWISAVLKYTLFPPGSPCIHGINQFEFSPGRRFVPSTAQVAREMHRVLKPGGIVANFEMWINESPDLFAPSFEMAGFITEQVNLLRRDDDCLNRFYARRNSALISPLLVSQIWSNMLYHFGDPRRPGFRDYFIVWRKPLSS